jgi:4-amino-4-deoxy-L-arabinose transferase-like glycosyltransferase
MTAVIRAQTQIPDLAAVSAAAAAPAKSGLVAWIKRRPGYTFAVFLAVHFVVWTALPTLLYANLPLDLIEALTYGREWVLGSDKLPPLPWWMVEIMYRLFGADVAYYALAEIVIVATFLLVWALSRPLVGAVGALVATLIVDGLHYFQYTAVKFNHDVIQLPLWALAGYSFHAALKRGHIRHWLLLGAAFGGALWAKYFVVVLAAPYALFMIFDRDARKAWRTPGPWLAIALSLVIASPHLVWLVQNDFLPFHYVDVRSAPVRGWYDHLLHPLAFAGDQLYFMLPALLIAAAYLWPRTVVPPAVLKATNPDRGDVDNFDRRIITLITFGPAAAMLVMIGLSGRGAIAMWGYPLWIFLGLWYMVFAPRPLDVRRLRHVGLAWGALFIALMVAFVVNYTSLPVVDHRYRAALFSGDKLAAILTQRFHAATGGKKLRYVVGSMWLAGNLAHYSTDQPQVLIDGLPHRAPWVDLKDMQAKGAVLVWNVGDLTHLPAVFAAVAPNAQVGTPFILPARRSGASVEHIGWAILLPQSSTQTTNHKRRLGQWLRREAALREAILASSPSQPFGRSSSSKPSSSVAQVIEPAAIVRISAWVGPERAQPRRRDPTRTRTGWLTRARPAIVR